VASPPKEQRGLRYRVPAGQAESKLVIKNSLFIGTVGRAPTVEAARAFIAQLKERYSDANHNAWAFKITGGPQGAIGFSDDGEPGGTAGRPMLTVLEGSGLWQVVAVVTRYFGGIKLGTGGLVRAYSAAVRQALKELPTTELVLHRLARLTLDYSLYNRLRNLLPQYRVKINRETFTDKATLDLAIPYERAEQLASLLRELSNGSILLNELWYGQRYDTED